jgi:hypothetical protein
MYKSSELNSFAPSYEGCLEIVLGEGVEATESITYGCWGRCPINTPANECTQQRTSWAVLELLRHWPDWTCKSFEQPMCIAAVA